MKYNAFSLIELMVVIAIVAILAAVAVPVYKTYTIKSKIQSVMPVVQGMIDKGKMYYEKHGDFATLAQIGIPTPVGQPDRTDNTNPPNSLADYYMQPYLMNVQMSPLSFAGNLYSCKGSITLFTVSNISNGAFTASNVSAEQLAVQIGTIAKDGIFYSSCIYGLSNNGPSYISGNYVPNCLNIADNPNAYNDQVAFLNSC